MRNVLMVSPHFPPDTSAGAHRVRLLAPHLPKYGWNPTVVAVDPRRYEGRLDRGLAELVPSDLRIVRARALPVGATRKLGIGDLGIRSFFGLLRCCSELLRRERFDVVFITIYPTYPALLGPILKRKFGMAVVLDYQDPWVSAWGETVGGGPNGRPDMKSHLTRALALRLEPLALRAADAVTAVSSGTYEAIAERNPKIMPVATMALPLGGEPADFDWLRGKPRANPFFAPSDGFCHICYVGTLLPLGFETLRAFFGAVALLREHRPDRYSRLKLHFFGTSNLTDARAPERVTPVARQMGIAECVSETAPRVDYLDALTVLTQATAILLMGSSERHYTASKLYPAMLAGRPVLAIYHEASTVVDILSRAGRSPTVRLVTYGDEKRAESRREAISDELVGLMEQPVYGSRDVDMSVMAQFSAESLAGELARLLDGVAKARSDCRRRSSTRSSFARRAS